MKHARCFLWAAVLAACWPAGGTGLLWAAEPGADDGPVVETDGQAPSGSPAGEEEPSSFLQRLDARGLFLDDNRWWHWLILLGAVIAGWTAGRIAATVLGQIARRLQARHRIIRMHVIRDLIGPAKLALLGMGIAVGLAALTMSDPLQQFCAKVLLLLYSIAVFWYAYNLVSIVDVTLRRITAKTESTLDDQLIPLARKGLRIVLVVVLVIFVIDVVFRQDVFALVAALGVLGLPLGFAAQDTLKNLFGAVIILFNRPFQVGERIVYAGYDGVIEEIGFQSIRVRTLDGHLVTIPNSKIASDPVQNVARRPYIKRSIDVTITYDTPKEKIQQSVEILRGILEEEDLRGPIHAVLDGDEYPPRVYFTDYNAESLNIRVIYWYVPPDYWDFMDHAQRLNLRIFEEYEKAGIEFAFPTQTLYLAGDPKRQLALKTLGAGLEPPQ